MRELRSAVESAMLQSHRRQVEDLPPEIRDSELRMNSGVRKRQAERVRMLGALQETGENCSEAERLLGMSSRTFYRRLSEDDASVTRDSANSAR